MQSRALIVAGHRDWAEARTLGHADASSREISVPDKRTRSNDGRPGSYQLARWVSTEKRACMYWSGHFRARRRKIANPEDAPSLALVTGVHRHDKRLKFWLRNSCRNAPEHQSVKRGNLLNRCRRHVPASTRCHMPSKTN